MTKRLIGIDFGTSTTIIHVKNYENGEPANHDKTFVQYVEFDGHGLVPTLIQEVEGTYYFGYDAKQPKQKGCLYRNFKLELESKDPEARKKAMELTKMFFCFLHNAYEEQQMHFGTAQYEKTLVSYPAKWKKETRDFMVSCAEEAGFQNVQGIDEPTAALYSVFVQEQERIKKFVSMDKDQPSYILMADMGAGTTDLILCSYTVDNNPEILLSWPKSEAPVFFGGHEVDMFLMDILKNYLLENGFSDSGVDSFMKRYEETCKTWKENTVSSVLNQGEQVDFCFFISSFFQIMGTEPGRFPVISRESLEHKAGGYLKLYSILINGLLDEAAKRVEGFTGGEMIDLVILTGGHSQWYFAKDILTGDVDTGIPIYMDKIKRQPERVIRISRPQETVARGMVYTAQNINYNVKNTDSEKRQQSEQRRQSAQKQQSDKKSYEERQQIYSGGEEKAEEETARTAKFRLSWISWVLIMIGVASFISEEIFLGVLSVIVGAVSLYMKSWIPWLFIYGGLIGLADGDIFLGLLSIVIGVGYLYSKRKSKSTDGSGESVSAPLNSQKQNNASANVAGGKRELKCPSCGEKNRDGSLFCRRCGTRLSE